MRGIAGLSAGLLAAAIAAPPAIAQAAGKGGAGGTRIERPLAAAGKKPPRSARAVEPRVSDEAPVVTLADPAQARPASPFPGPLALPANPLVFAEGQSAPRGYIPIPSARTFLRVAGFLKLDAIHDTGPYTGDASDLPNLSLRGGGQGEQRYGLTRLHARESRLSLGTFTDTPAGPVVAFLEADFFGSAGANTYGLRMRHAYLSWKALLAGHTYSNFLDVDARGTTIEFNGPTAAGNRKRAQVRLSHQIAPGVFGAVAFENGAADYTAGNGSRVTAADSILILDSDVVQQLPDVTGHLRFVSELGHLALRGMARQLRVLPPGGLGAPHLRYGYGLAISGRWQYEGRSNLFAQATGGQGLGGYVDDLDGQAATFDQAGQRFLTQLGYAALAGAEHYLSPQWRFNVIGSVSGIQLPVAAPAGPEVAPISRRFLQLFANLLYAPTDDLLMGIEYGYYQRETNTPFVGWSHRVQMGILYRFGG